MFRRLASFWVALAALLASACSREDVTHYRVAKEVQPSVPAAAAQPVAAEPSPVRGRALRWTLPTGWSEEAGGQMRYATLKPPVAGRIDGSVVVLPGAAGGELANVNRWRSQIGLGPIDDAALAKARKLVKTKAGPLKVYDFTSEGEPRNRLVAGLTEAGGDTWFVKLTGDAHAVGAAREDFLRLLGSLRFE